MKTETKILFGVLVTLLVALPIVSYTMATSELNTNYTVSPTNNNEIQRQMLQTIVEQRMECRGEIIRWFLKNAEPVIVEGAVVTNSNNILVISSEGELLNILLPRQWSVNDQVYKVFEIFDQGILTGEVTVKSLQGSFTNEKGVQISLIVAYEITVGENVLHAVIPINIEA